MQFTKKISLKTKIISAMLAFILAFCFMLPASIFTINASALDDDWDSIVVSGLETEYEIFNNVNLPNIDGAKITVKDPRGKKILEEVSGAQQFEATIAGKYQLTYTKGNATTGVIYINVVAKELALQFPKNSENIIPSKIPTNQKLVFPNAEIIDEDGKIVDGKKADIKLKVAESNTIVDLETYEDSYKAYTFVNEGKYELTYSYGGNQESNANLVTESYIIEVIKDYDGKQKISYTLDSAMPTSAIQGVEVELPTVKGKAENGEAINVFASIKVMHVDSKDKRTDVTASDLKGFKFTPSKAGNYEITYTVKDLFNTTEKMYMINDVYDSQAPKIQVVENYEIETDGENKGEVKEGVELVDAEDTIPTKVAKGKPKKIPAIYASDNVVAYKDLKLTRRIKKDSGEIINLDKEGSGNKKNEAVNYTFEEAGKYTVIYSASDGDNSTSDIEKSFIIEVKENFTDKVAPKITINEFVSDDEGRAIYAVKPNQKIRVAIPNVVDLVDPEDPSNKDVNDLSPILKAYAYVTSATDIAKVELKLDKDGKYFEYVVPNEAAGTISIMFKAIDDSKNEKTETKTIDVINTNDKVAPVFTNDFNPLNAASLTPDENGVVTLYTNENIVTATDESDKNLDLSIVVRNPNGKVVDIYDYERNVEALSSGSKATATAKFRADLSGVYTINYIAKDAGGNISIQARKIDVTAKKHVSLVATRINEQELGEVVIPKAFLYVDGVLQESSAIKTTIIGDMNKHNEVVTVKYSATVDGVTATDEVTFTVKDTSKPTISLDGELSNFAKLEEIAKTNPIEYKPIDIPAFTVNDEGTGVNFDTVRISVKDSKGNEVTLIDSEANEVTEIVGNSSASKFIPTKDGKYTITFEAQDFAGNSVKETRTIAVGDIKAPKLEIKNEKDIPTNVKLQDGKYTLSLDIDSSKIKITDKVDGEDIDLPVKVYLEVTVTGPNGNTVKQIKEGEYNYELTEAGTYKIKYVAVDKADNTQVREFTLTVSAEDNKGATVTEVLGTVLLIISILVLAGVVWYFVKPAKRPKTKETIKVEDSKKEEK